jgi:mycofactocin precursor
MSDTMTQDPVVELTAEAPSIEADETAPADGEALAEPLIEEISIDGMCGVY